MARSALYALLLTACAALRLAPTAPRLHAGRRRAFALAPRTLFGGAPPEEESKPAAPAGGGSGMSVPGMGEISERELNTRRAWASLLMRPARLPAWLR